MLKYSEFNSPHLHIVKRLLSDTEIKLEISLQVTNTITTSLS